MLETLEPRPKEVSETAVYVREGHLHMWDLDGGKRVDRVFYLFKEHLVVAEARKGKKAKLKMTVDLSSARVEALQDGACTHRSLHACMLVMLTYLPQRSWARCVSTPSSSTRHASPSCSIVHRPMISAP